MSDAPRRRALILTAGPTPGTTRWMRDGVAHLAEALDRHGWEVSIRPLASAGASTRAALRSSSGTGLVVLVLGDDHRAHPLRAAALVARRALAPLVVVTVGPGGSAVVPDDRLTRVVTDRVVSRHLAGPTAFADCARPELLDGLGLGPEPAPHQGTAPLGLDDLGAVVRIHRSAFPGSALTHLGPNAVDRYYRWQFVGAHPAPFAAGAWRDGVLVGFVFGGLRHDAVSGYARRFLPTIARSALTHPAGLRRLALPKVAQVARLMVRPRRTTTPPEPVDPGPGATSSEREPVSFGILSIAVDPGAQGSGVATTLLDEAEQRARALGIDRMHLTVDVGNEAAGLLYARTGWVRTPDGPAWRGKMVKHLDT